MAVTFSVDDVEPRREAIRTVRLDEYLGSHVALGVAGAIPVLPIRPGRPPLLAAVHHAYDLRRPLALTPDAVWLTILQGVAEHARLHPELVDPRARPSPSSPDSLRTNRRTASEALSEQEASGEAAGGLAPPLTARADARQATRGTCGGESILDVTVPDAPLSAEDWAGVIELGRRALAPVLLDGPPGLFEAGFSTSTWPDQVAAELASRELVARPSEGCCPREGGIPELTLLGTPLDWRALRERLRGLAELGLRPWLASLEPIADRLVDAAEGRPDRDFFRRIYEPRSSANGSRFTGWIGRLHPYLRRPPPWRRGRWDGAPVPNELLARPLDDVHVPADPRPQFYDGPGVPLDVLAPGPSVAVLRLLVPTGGPARLLALEGGLLAVGQDPEGRLVPRAGVVLRAPATTSRSP